MGTYAQFIAKLRIELKDTGKNDYYIVAQSWDGDGSNKLFYADFSPIKDGSYEVKIGAAVQTETTHYTLDKDTGLITFVSAPAAGSNNVTMTYQSVNVRDDEYIEFINDGIDHFRWKFWLEAMDEDTLTTTRNEHEKDVSDLTDILHILNVWYKTSSNSTDWITVQSLTNWKYYTRQQKLAINPPFSTSSLPMKFRYLKSIAKGDEGSDTLNIPAEWQLPYKYYIYARYYERLIAEKIHETGAVTTQPSFAPAQLAFDISKKFYEMADAVANKIAPKLPPMSVKQVHDGVSL